MDETGLESCPVTGFDIMCAELLGSGTTLLDN